jgi:hypothetical protein
MCTRYVLGSPSFRYGDKIMFGREKAYNASHKDLPANVFFAVGSLETVKPDSKHARYNERNLSVGPNITTRGLKWALPANQ